MTYPAYDLCEYANSQSVVSYCDNLPNSECVDFETVTQSNQAYEYGSEGACQRSAVVQARILRETHADMRTAIETMNTLFDGKALTINGTTYEIFVNSSVYQGFRQIETGNYRYAVVTMTLHY